MDIVRAFTFPFDDRSWIEKLLITLVITAITIMLTPLFIGLLGWAALLGYQVELVRNWRSENPTPLPSWNNFSRLLNVGFYPLVALLIYQIPNVIIGSTILLLGQNLGAGVVGSTLTVFFSCCMLPILILYNVFMLPMFALGMGRFVDDPRLNVFLEIGYLLVTLRDHMSVAMLYLIFLVIANIVFSVGGAVTVGLLPMVLGVAVFGALNGQLAAEILGKPKRVEEVVNKPKRR